MKTESTEREFLTEREFRRLVFLKRTSVDPKNPRREALHLFLMECYTGMRISDLLTLKWKHYQDGLIKRKMEKTKDIIAIMAAEIDVADEMIGERYIKATRGNKTAKFRSLYI